jgi:16S rRNA processing protein RimM
VGSETDLLEVGRILRAHGLRGDVTVRLLSNHLDRLAPGAELHAGDRILVVARSRQHAERWVVGFEGVDDRAGAEALCGTELCAHRIVDDPDGFWVHDLVGAEVVDAGGASHGTVTEVLANPASDLLVLPSGTLVPLTFVSWDDEGRLVVDAPPGLLDHDEQV